MKVLQAIIYFVLLQSLAFSPCATAQDQFEIRLEQCLGGNLDAPIRIQVFSDFMCTHCRELFLSTISQVLKEYSSTNKVCVMYYEFPLPTNKYSRQAAQYSKAAQKLGKEQWYAVMEALYENQSQWIEDGSIDKVLSKALAPDDYNRIRELRRKSEIDKEISREFALGEKKKIRETPTFFVKAQGREQRVTGFLPYATLKDFFDKVLK
jgi:protein-disulfide isomerase